ncbi:DMT family transporter [Cognatiluteimonas profundi]|uniref:DMT family transporter n=1 Tax=Cognatiluteimonas profundi TaxID=2594501 RepID=UPI00131E0B21|nr:EamA family transporter [Lysobacter profundi]
MAFDTEAQISFKLAGMHAFPPRADLHWLLSLFGHPWIYGAVVGYVGAFFTWIKLLRRAPIGPAFAASHMEVVSVMLVSAIAFGEHVGPMQGLGAVVIVGGIACLAMAGARETLPGDAATSLPRKACARLVD